MKKFLATIIIIGLISSIGFNLFIFKPKQAQAVVDVLGGPWQPPATLKELVLDTIGHTITQSILQRLEQKIADWGMGRNSDSNEPLAVIDWVQFFNEAVNRGAAKFIADYEQVFDLSDRFQSSMKSFLDSLGFDTYPQDLPNYAYSARPTLKNDLEDAGLNYQDFVDSGYSLVKGGWAGWFSMMKPENNIFGQAMMAEAEKFKRITEEKEAANKEVIGGSIGYKNETTTTKTDVEACLENCALNYPMTLDYPNDALGNCEKECESRPGIPIETKIKNLGSTIETSMQNALGADIQRLISTDEITELLGVLYSALLNKAMYGMGLAFSATTSSKADRTRSETKTAYSYQRIFKKEQTTADIKTVRSEILSNILKSMQQLDRSITTCKGDEMMTYDDYSKNLADIFSGNVEALYIGLEGVNLKPDFEVLDPRFAPYTVYGYSWSNVPASKFPEKCQKITAQLNLSSNATCKNIQSGLEPNIHSACQSCVYDHDSYNCPPAPYPPQSYPTTGVEPWTETILTQKSDYWWDCKNQYNTTIDRCDDCLKAADEKCGELDKEQKQECITNHCSNYSDITNNITGAIADGLDFYNKCLIEEKKDCYVCVKEYFAPATYCEQTKDYVARSITKYPALVKKVRNNAPDHEIWLGPYDKIFAEQGGEDCDNNDESQSIDLSLICRIMPDFNYYGKVCETQCNQRGLSQADFKDILKDITDFRPNGKDCGNMKLSIGGKEPWAPINDGVFQIRGKCCAALHDYDKDKYQTCVGSGASTAVTGTCTYGLPVDQEPWCYCEEGYRPLGFTRTGNPSRGSGVAIGGDCGDFTFQYPAEGLPRLSAGSEIYGVTNNSPIKGDTVYIGGSACKEGEINDVDIIASGSEEFDSGGGGSSAIDPIAPWGTNWAELSKGNKILHFFTEEELSVSGDVHTGVYIVPKGQPGYNATRDPNNSTGWHICALCGEDYTGYPNYGTAYDQCHKNK